MRTDNHNLFKNPPMTPIRDIQKREFCDITKLRIAIQQSAIKYPRVATQDETQYADALARIMASKGFGDVYDLAPAIDKYLFGFLYKTYSKEPEN